MLSGLNSAQREAVRYLDGPCLVLAGAGSGKTRVITRKIAWLMRECGLDAGHIAAITFTNKAAREMQQRVAKLLRGASPGALTVSTFHALGVRIIREEAKACGLKKHFSILDANDALQVVNDLASDANKAAARRLLGQISAWKNALLDPTAAAAQASDDEQQYCAALYAEYERSLRAYQAVDFDDLITLPARLFERDDSVRERWQGRLRYLLVDEYQDTNHAQYRLLRLLAGVRGALTAVGDDDQGIYGWRGADIENLRRLGEDYPQLKVIKLEQNYRSSRNILAAANALIGHNPRFFDKSLWSELGAGEPVRAEAARDAEEEARRVVERIGAHQFSHNNRWSEYAVLYRGNHQARVLEKYLRSRRIPYLVSGGQSFFERSEIRDLIAWLRLLANPDDDLAFIRALTTPRRGVGSVSVEALGHYAALRQGSLFQAAQQSGVEAHIKGQALSALQTFVAFVDKLRTRAQHEAARTVLEHLLDAIGYKDWLFSHEDVRSAHGRWNNVLEFVDWLGGKGEQEQKNLIDLTQTIALMSLLEKNESRDENCVQLATLHAAKGLEFGHVFLVGVEEGLLPHQGSIDEGRLEEERRLLYVGITRARKSLSISWCERRQQGRESRPCEESRFIAELGESAVVVSAASRQVPLTQEAGRERAARLAAMFAELDGDEAPKM